MRNPPLAISFDDVFVLYESRDEFARGARSGVFATFGPAVAALRGLSLDVREGERIVVRGPSGSGKSTLVSLVTGQVAPSAGVVRFFDRGLPIGGEVLRRSGRLAVVTQGSGRELVPEISCLHNVALNAELRGVSKATARRDAEVLLDRFGVGELASRMPTDLSGGEAQKVALAAALGSSPAIVVADEPTGDLDRRSAETIYDLLAEHVLRSGAALLLVSHDDRAQRIADRVVSIRDGRFEGVHDSGETTHSIVVDSRGWMRLPEAQRRAAGVVDRAVASLESRGILLHQSTTGTSDHGFDPVWDRSAGQGPELRLTSSESHLSGATLARVDNVSVVLRHRQGASQILAPTSFSIRPARLHVVAGPSGSGKTTLLSVLGGLRQPTTGSIYFNGEPSVAFAAQAPGFAEDATVAANLVLQAALRSEALGYDEVLKILCTLGIEHLAERPVRTLSGGERQRAGVARVLLSTAELLLIDEPTSQLDEISSARTVMAIQQVARCGVAIVVASHDDSVISAADEIISLG